MTGSLSVVNVKFIFTDANENFLMPSSVFDTLSIPDVSMSVHYVGDNKIPLSRLYNTILDDERNDNVSDFIVFMHGDVVFDVHSFISHLLEIKDRYDVIGLAGTKKMNTSASPLNWFTSSNVFPDQRFGDITMNDGKRDIRCFYNESTNPDVGDTRVACIDGLCIIVGRTVINSDFRFTEGVSNFDFYDTDISLKSNLIYKFRLGVMVEPVRHLSVGRSILSERFREDEKKFREVFNIPLNENEQA